MDSLIVKVFTFLQLIMILTRQSNADLGLSSLTGNLLGGNLISQPASLLKAAVLANDASKLLPIPTDHKVIVDSTFKVLENYVPIEFPSSPTSDAQACDEQIRLEDRSLKLHLPPDKMTHLIQTAGLDSKNIDWQLYKCPLTVNQLKKIFASKSSSSSSSNKLKIMAIDSYLTKMLSNIEGLQDTTYRSMEKCFESDISIEEFAELLEQLDSAKEGLIILPGVGLKTGTLAGGSKRAGSMILFGVGKFPPGRRMSDPPEIVPTILIGQVKQVSPSQYKSEPIVEGSPVLSTPNPETVVLETPKSDPIPPPTVLEANETPLAQHNPSASSTLSLNQPAPASAQSFFNPSNSQPSSINYPPPPPIPQQAQRPMQRPPPPQQQRPNMRPASFDSRTQHIQQFQQQTVSRPLSRLGR